MVDWYTFLPCYDLQRTPSITQTALPVRFPAPDPHNLGPYFPYSLKVEGCSARALKLV